MRSILLLLSLSFALLASPGTWADPAPTPSPERVVQLFELVEDVDISARRSLIPAQVEDYEDLVTSLQEGDTIEFSDGTRFRIGRKLGAGNTTLIFELADQPGRAIRIPLRAGRFRSIGAPYPNFITSFINGGTPLRRLGVPTVRVFGGSPDEYVVVEKLPVDDMLSLKDMLFKEDLSPSVRLDMREALLRLARRVAGFSSIGDFHYDQIRYDPKTKDWRLLDWTGSHKPGFRGSTADNMELSRATPFDGDTDFWSSVWIKNGMSPSLKVLPTEPKYGFVANLANELRDVVIQERIRILADPDLRVLNDPRLVRNQPAAESLRCLESLLFRRPSLRQGQ